MNCTAHRTPSWRDGDLELLGSAGGDQQAFAQLHRRYAARVFGLANTILRDPALAEDVAQEVFLELWRKGFRFDPDKGSATSWIMTLTRSRAIDRVRSTELSRTRDTNWTNHQGTRDVDCVMESVLVGLAQDQVRVLLGTLSTLQRETIELTYFRGLNSAEVGRLLGTSPQTIKSRARDGLIRMRRHLQVAALVDA